MPTTNEKLVKRITESLDRLSASMTEAATISATATGDATTLLGAALSGISVGGAPFSTPPTGCFKVTNIYVSEDGKLKIEYDDTPIP